MRIIKYIIVVAIVLCIIQWGLSQINPYAIVIHDQKNVYTGGDSISYEYSVTNYSLLPIGVEHTCQGIGGNNALSISNTSILKDNTLMEEDGVCLMSYDTVTIYPFGSINAGQARFILIDENKDCDRRIQKGFDFKNYNDECVGGIRVKKGSNDILIGPEKNGKILTFEVE